MLMSAVLSNYDIRHEEPYKVAAGKGAPKQVDLRLRPHNGGIPLMMEAGDFAPGKVHRDLAKLKKLNPKGTNCFLAFFREAPVADDPLADLNRIVGRKSGLDAKKVKLETSLVMSFNVFRPNGTPDKFGVALLRGR